MPRRRRTWEPLLGAHTISRFVDRRFHLFDAADRLAVLDAIGRAHERWDWEWLSYALMSSHMHFGYVAGHDDPDRFFRSAHTRVAQGFHRRRPNETLGPVFASRPNLYVVESTDLPRMVAYHHRNPVSAGLVQRPRDSTWTSHRAYLRLELAPDWLDVERGLATLGFDDTDAGRSRFDDFVMEVDLDAWRASRRRSDRAELATTQPASMGRDEWERLVCLAGQVAGFAFDVPLTSRRRDVVITRRLVAVLAVHDIGVSYGFVAERLQMRAGSVSNMVTRPTPQRFAEMLRELRRLWAGAPRSAGRTMR